MEAFFKIIWDEDGNISLLLYRNTEIDSLLEILINLLHYAYQKIIIIPHDNHYEITDIGSNDSFNILFAYIEELYIWYIDDDLEL